MDLALLDPDIEVCVHDQKQFPGKALHEAMSDMASLSLSVDKPSQEELANWEDGSPDLLGNATVKLAKRVEGANLDTDEAQGVERSEKRRAGEGGVGRGRTR